MKVRLLELYRRILEADFPWHKFPKAGGPAIGGSPDPMGTKHRDVSRIGPQYKSATGPRKFTVWNVDHEGPDIRVVQADSAADAFNKVNGRAPKGAEKPPCAVRGMQQ